MDLNDSTQYTASIIRNEEEGKADAQKRIIEQFRYAPFILRRMDILNFWNQQIQRKLMLFFKYVKTDSEKMVTSDSEIIAAIEHKRVEKKKKNEH